MRRAVVTDTTTGAEECLDRCQNQGHPSPPLSLTLLRSHDALGSRGQRLQRRGGSGGATSWFCGRPGAETPRTQRQRGHPHPNSATSGMATASTSGQSSFGLGRKKKNPGLMDQIGLFFGGDKKKRSKVSSSIYSGFQAAGLRQGPGGQGPGGQGPGDSRVYHH